MRLMARCDDETFPVSHSTTKGLAALSKWNTASHFPIPGMIRSSSCHRSSSMRCSRKPALMGTTLDGNNSVGLPAQDEVWRFQCRGVVIGLDSCGYQLFNDRVFLRCREVVVMESCPAHELHIRDCGWCGGENFTFMQMVSFNYQKYCDITVAQVGCN